MSPRSQTQCAACRTPSGNNVTDKCLDYLRPLIEGEVRYRTEAGLPVHFKI